MDQTPSHDQDAIPDSDRHDELADRVHRHPDPLRRSRQTLDRLGLGDLTRFDGAEQGEQFSHLHRLDVEIVQEVAREGSQITSSLHQPTQNGVGIGLKDPGHRP